MTAPMKFLTTVLAIFTLSLIVNPFRPRLSRNPGSLEEIESYLRHLTSQNQPPSVSIVVVKGNETVYASGFGIADPKQPAPASPETLYHWWSMTKVPTAVATLQLKDKGLLELDDPVSKFLPFFEVSLDGEPAPMITIRQLLSHTSGLPDPMPAMIGWVHFEDRTYNQTELLQQHLDEYSDLEFAPGSKSSYSNLGYIVLGAVVESVSGKSYEDYIETEILVPLEMKNTGFLYSEGENQQIAAGSHPLISIYTPLLPILLDLNKLIDQRIGSNLWFNPVYTDATPSSGLIGSAEDVALLAKALLTEDPILSQDSHLLLYPQGVQVTERPLGWAEFSTESRLWVQHRGGGPGFATLMRLYPNEDLAIIIMANSTNLAAERIANAYANINWNND